mgnify:CR=1 FL=1
MIDFEHVTKVYETQNDENVALEDINIHIDEGEFVFILGHSGAGKSTFLKLIQMEEKPTKGKVFINGQDLTHIRRRKVPYLRRQMGVVFQDFRLIEKKTVYENLSFAMRAVGSSPREIKKRIPYVLELVGLEEKTDRYPNELSGGEQQMLAMGRALMSNASMLMLDEPSMGLSPLLVQEIFDIIRNIHKEGMTILLVEQNAQMALSVADRAYVLETGRVVMEGTGAELLTNERVRSAYLGG